MTLTIADLSEYQGTIDWAAYGAANPAVIVRAHNGNRADNKWARNLTGARAHTRWRGFYQYLPADVNPATAARAFAATVGPLQAGEVMILDIEAGTGDQRARRQAWLDALKAPVEWTYSGMYFARQHLPGVHVEWVAAYGQAEPSDAHSLWQFTSGHRFPGITGPCDASTFHGTIAQLVALTGSTTPPPEVDMPLTPAEIDAVAVAAAEQVWNRFKVHTTSGDIPLQQALGRILAGPDPAKFAAAVVAALPAGGLDQAAVEAALRAVLTGTTITLKAGA